MHWFHASKRALAAALLLLAAAADCSDDPRARSSGSSGDGGEENAGGHEACSGAPCGVAAGCCGTGERCCTAAANGYDTGDVCRLEGAACPVGCSEGGSECAPGQYCQLDPRSGQHVCVDTCPPAAQCGDGVCCPLGSRCTNGSCGLADLTVDQGLLGGHVFLQKKHFDAGACEIVEGCVAAPGDRTLLVFPLESPNVGVGDLWLGQPDPSNHLFQYSSCHNHYHFTGYVAYKLLDTNHGLVAPGQKQAFCLLDTTPVLPDAPTNALYDCTNQGIQRGWADVYGVGLPCQWVDVTGVPPGSYILQVDLNPQRVIAESSYDDNKYEVPVTIAAETASSCPNGCDAFDEVCCRPGDPCGWGANGSCDCANRFGWDDADCATCLFDDPNCFPGFNSCPAGCTQSPSCCDASNPCGLADDGSCDCGGALAWDYDDCWYCSAPDPDCPGH